MSFVNHCCLIPTKSAFQNEMKGTYFIFLVFCLALLSIDESRGALSNKVRCYIRDRSLNQETLLIVREDNVVSCVAVGVNQRSGWLLSSMIYKEMTQKRVEAFVHDLQILIDAKEERVEKENWVTRIVVYLDEAPTSVDIYITTKGPASNEKILLFLEKFINENSLYKYDPKPPPGPSISSTRN